MSIEAVGAVIRYKEGAPGHRWVLLHLCDAANREGLTTLGQGALADAAGVDVTTIKRTLRALEDGGAIRRLRRDSPGGGRLADLIALTFGPYRGNRGRELPGSPLDDEEDKVADRHEALGADRPEGDPTLRNAPTSPRPTGGDTPGPKKEEPTAFPSEDIESREGKATGYRARALAKEWSFIAEPILAACPPKARARVPDDRKVAWAIRDWFQADPERADPDAMVAAMLAYYAQPRQREAEGQFAAAPHRMIEDNRWEHYTGALPRHVTPAQAAAAIIPADRIIRFEFEGVNYELLAPEDVDLGDVPIPAARQQIQWLQEFARQPNHWRRNERGPTPDEPGNRIWPSARVAHLAVQEAKKAR